VLAKRVAAIPAVDKASWAADVARLAGEVGFSFDARDIDAAVEEQQQLSAELGEAELGSVAGGAQYQETDLDFMSRAASTNFYDAWPCKWYVPER
jgi:hypothetical protein